MKDITDEKPEKDPLEKVRALFGWDQEDYPEVEEEYSEKVTPKEMDSWLQTLTSSKGKKWSRRSLLLVGILCVVLAVLQLSVISFMKPKVKRAQLVGKRKRLPIRSIEREEEPTIPLVVGRKGMEEKSSGGGTLEEEKPIVSKAPEPSMMLSERGIDERVVIIGATGEAGKTQAEERRYRDTILGEEILEGDTKIGEKTPETISVREEPSTGEIHERSVKEISQPRPITAGAVEVERETGRIEVIPTKTSEPREKPLRQPSRLSYPNDLSDTRALKKYDFPSTIQDKSISVGRFPIDSSWSIEREERVIQAKLPSLIATEEEVRQFFVNYTERYNQRDIAGFLSLFSPEAVQNRRGGFDEIKKAYSDFFDKSQELRYHIEDTKIEIYQNGVEVKGRFRVDQILKKRGKKRVLRGDIRWILVRENDALKISLLDYGQQESP